MKLIAKMFFWITGWKTIGEAPPLKKYVAIFAPHTSTRDFVYVMCAKFIFGIPITFLGKAEVFKPPFGFIFKWLGGMPVERSERHNLVDQVVKMFDEHDIFIVAISPEGTRAYVPVWKTGFYYIALHAKVPILLTYLDFPNKIAGLGPLFYPTGDIDKDIEKIKDFYRPIRGMYPEKGVN